MTRGIILSVSRRAALVELDTVEPSTEQSASSLKTPSIQVSARIRNELEELAACDEVKVEGDAVQGYYINQLYPRKNILLRSYETRIKRLVANVDRVVIVTAGGELLNLDAIDRVLAACHAAEIPAVMVCNKIDAGLSEADRAVLLYYQERLQAPVFFVSVRTGQDIEPLVASLAESGKVLTFCGISGVGKSSLLKYLIPNLQVRVSETSERTGQGKQTTSQAVTYAWYPSQRQDCVRIVDCPGIQHFGVAHLSADQILHGMPDIFQAALGCRFRDCKHLQEPDCEVRKQAEAGDIMSSRMESYFSMVKEASFKSWE